MDVKMYFYPFKNVSTAINATTNMYMQMKIGFTFVQPFYIGVDPINLDELYVCKSK